MALRRAPQPGVFVGVRNMHEFEAEGSAVGATQDRHHPEYAGVFQTEHPVDDDCAIVILVGKAIGRRIQLPVILTLLELERIEIGVQMAAHAIRADRHQSAHAVARRLLDLFTRQRRLRRNGSWRFRLTRSPIPAQRRDEFPVHYGLPRGLRPGRAGRLPFSPGVMLRPVKNSRQPRATDAGSAS